MFLVLSTCFVMMRNAFFWKCFTLLSRFFVITITLNFDWAEPEGQFSWSRLMQSLIRVVGMPSHMFVIKRHSLSLKSTKSTMKSVFSCEYHYHTRIYVALTHCTYLRSDIVQLAVLHYSYFPVVANFVFEAAQLILTQKWGGGNQTVYN